MSEFDNTFMATVAAVRDTAMPDTVTQNAVMATVAAVRNTIMPDTVTQNAVMATVAVVRGTVMPGTVTQNAVTQGTAAEVVATRENPALAQLFQTTIVTTFRRNRNTLPQLPFFGLPNGTSSDSDNEQSRQEESFSDSDNEQSRQEESSFSSPIRSSL
jgi:hypothetical protein